jgi:hypothetical protein
MYSTTKRNIAMVLGAGASKAFNYPLTREILKLVIDLINNDKPFADDAKNKNQGTLYKILLKKLLTDVSPGLKPVMEKKIACDPDKLPLITDLLSQAEHLYNHNQALTDFNYDINHSLTGEISSLNERWQLKDVITLLEWAIIKVINDSGDSNLDKLNGFSSWVRKTNKGNEAFVSIISSNYDYSVEWNLLEYGEALESYNLIDYGFNWRDIEDGEVYLRPVKPMFRMFKLHGSSDWLKCDRCGIIYVNTAVDIFDLAFSNKKKDMNSCHCGYWPLLPVLVTPSFTRVVNDSNLSQVWRNTLELLRIADEWIIVGYSLPAEDLDIKSLFLRALKGRTKPPVIKVIQHSDKSRPVYDYFFGEGKYEFIDGGFENFDFNRVQLIK